MTWCPCDADECDVIRELNAGAITDNGGFEFTLIPPNDKGNWAAGEDYEFRKDVDGGSS